MVKETHFVFLFFVSLQVALHACGVATDMVTEHCIQAGAAFVISPCCYGFIQNAIKFTFPKRFVPALLSPVFLSGLLLFKMLCCFLVRLLLALVLLISLSIIFFSFFFGAFCLSLILTLSHPRIHSLYLLALFSVHLVYYVYYHHHGQYEAVSHRLHNRVRLSPFQS